MNPGLFKHPIVFMKSQLVEDELGQILTQWAEYKQCFAMIKTVQGREYFAAASTQNENTTRFVIRYRTDIDEAMRISYKEKVYEIESIINDDEMNKTLTIIAKG